jgi:hypothetical protein
MFAILICLLIPIFGAIRFSAGGAITPGEFLMIGVGILMLPAIVTTAARSEMRSLLFMCVAYFLAQVITDVICRTPTVDYLRGWARIGMMTSAFLVMSVLIGTNIYRMLAFILGSTYANAFSAIFIKAAYAEESDAFYKFIIGAPISFTVFALAGFASTRLKVFRVGAPFAAGIGAFLMNARSLAGITILAAASQWIFDRPVSQIGRIGSRGVIGSIALLVSAGAIFQFYTYAAPAGLLGEKAKARYEYQKGTALGKQFSLLDGRKELQFSLPKITQSPIIGYGSWVKDRVYVYNRMLQLGTDPQRAAYVVASTRGQIPTHSHLFGAWLETGIVGALFWAGVLVRAALILFRGQLVAAGKLAPVLYLVFIGLMWDVLFSPFGGEKRIYNGFILWLLVAIPMMATSLKANASAIKAART